jgi:hypothetical protein
MPNVLVNQIQITALAPGVPTAYPHGLTIGTRDVVPDRAEASDADLEVQSADATTVTVINNGAAPVSGYVECERRHTVDRALLPGLTDLPMQPFLPRSPAGAAAVTNPLILATGDAVVTAPAGQASAAIGHGAGGGVGTGEVQVNGVDSGMAMGWVEPGGAGDTCRIRVSSEGGFAFGSAAGQGNGYLSEIEAGGQYGTFAGGRAYPYNNGNSTIRAIGDAGFAFGYAGGYPASIYAAASGCFAQGQAYGQPFLGARIQAGRFARNGAFAQGDATGGTIYARGSGSFAQGRAQNGGTLYADGAGAFVQGYALGLYGGPQVGEIEATAAGARAMGYVRASALGDSYIRAQAKGALVSGYALNGGTLRATANANGSLVNGHVVENSIIEATFEGAFASGYVHGTYPAYPSRVDASNYGSMAFGYVYGSAPYAIALGSRIRTNGYGAMAHGKVWNGRILSNGYGTHASGAVSEYGAIIAGGRGSQAVGYARTDSVLGISGISRGAWAGGFAEGGYDIYATADGAFAFGAARVAGYITASARGAFAFGDATAGNIVASQTNAFQLGVGTNALADTVQIGAAGLRLKQTVGAPGVLQNGDIWISGGYVYIRSNGVSQKI